MITVTEIQKITEHCIKLLSFTEYLRRDNNTEQAYTCAEDILKSTRKLLIASMMYDKQLICISGLQGAGKTTLMKNFYKLDSKFLDPTLGRGERVPVIITEKRNIKTPTMYAIKIDKDESGIYSKQSIKVSAEEYISASKGEDSKIMYLELYVPYMHTENEGVSFMLLPGFEKENDYWNNLIEFSVNSSDAAVFVFDPTSFSNEQNEKHLDRIEKKFGKNVIYVISHSEGTPDDNAQVKDTCIKTLNIPSKDRVVCVGLYADEEKNRKWINDLKNALNKYAYDIKELYQKNNKYLYEEALKINDKLYEILNIINDSDDTDIKEHRNDALLRAFDNVVKKKKTELEKILADEFKKACDESIKNLEKLFYDRDRTIGGRLKQVKQLLFGKNVKEQFTETREMIEKSLKYKGNLFLPDKHLALALQRSLIALDHPEEKTNLSKLIETKKEKENTLLLTDSEITQNTIEDIRNFLSDNDKQEIQVPIKSSNPKKLLGAIVELGTYYFYLMSHEKLAQELGLSYYVPSNTLLDPDKVLSGAKSSAKFVVGMAGMIGFDLIEDGSINMLSKIAAAFGASAAVGNIFGLTIIGLGASAVVMKDLNRMQREDFLSAKNAVNGVYDNLKDDVLDKYSTYMGKIRDVIENKLYELSGDGKKVVNTYNAKLEVNNVLNLLDKISKRYANKMESALS